MDAAQTNLNLKKISFFLAMALLLTAPQASAAAPTLTASTTSVTIGSSSCNDYQNVILTSSAGSATPINFTVGIQYSGSTPTTGDANGNWLYTTISGTGTTSTGATFTGSTGATGVTLTIGLNRSIGAVSDTAYVVVTDQNNASDVVNITSYYSQNTSCGGNTGSTSNNYITVTPGNVALTAATNGSQSQTLSIQNVTGGSYAFTPTVTPASSWLSVSAASVTISANGTTSINVTANASQTSGVGSYTGSVVLTPQQGYGGTTLNIPVAFVVTSGTTTGGGSGTLTINGATATSFTTAIDYVSPNTPGGQCINIQDTASGANSYATQVTTTNGISWLLANYATSGSYLQILAPGNGACVTLSLSNAGTQLTSGAYQGQVAITSSSGSTATINVNLYVSAGAAPGISVSPSLIYSFNNVASASSVNQQAQFTVTAASGYSMSTASLSSPGANGFNMTTPYATNNSQTFTVSSNSNGLATGLYSTTVTVQSTYNGSTNNTTITIVLPVGQSGTTTTSGGATTVAPLSLAFEEQLGNNTWIGGREAQNLTITGTQGTQWSAAISYSNGSSWLSFDSSPSSGTFGNTPASLTVDLYNGVTSLAASSTPYQATVAITTPNGTTYVQVSVLVTAQNTPVLLGYPASATFNATTGTATNTQSVTIVGSDNTGSLTSPSIAVGTATASWLTAAASGNTMTLSVNTSGQSTGVYSATVPVSASAYSSAGAINYPVVMIVNGGGTTGTSGPLTLSTTSLAFSNVTGQNTQNLNVTASTNTYFTVTSSENNCNTYSWLQVTNNVSYLATSTVTPISITVVPGSIANGTTCTGLVTLVSTGSNSGTQTVAVSMTVGTSTSNVTVSPTTLTFAYTQGQSVPAAQIATIVNATSGTAITSFTVGVAETSGTSVTWLQTNLGTSTASTPYNSPGLSVSVAPGSLAAGTYTGTVTITPSGGTASTIGVTLTVAANAVVSATPTTISLSYNEGGTSPTSTILVSAGGATAGFTATAASSQNWLVVSPTTGTTPNTGTFNLTVSADPTALSTLAPSSTPYTGTITIQGTSPATGTTIVNVSLTVTAPLPAITGVINAGSGATGAVSPGEIISIFGAANGPIGPATKVQLDSTTCPSPCTLVPTKMGGVQVKFLPGGQFAPLTYVSAGQVNAIVPYGVAGQAGLSVEVLYLGQTSNIQLVGEVATAPGLFTATGTGTGQIAALQYDTQGNQSYNLAATPAKAGWTLVLYLTGEGTVSPLPADGAVTVYNASANPPVPVPVVTKPTVTIGGQPATVSFYGEAPNLVSGVLQMNVIVPAGAGTGPQQISVTLGAASTQAGATVALQ
jgi:uncharacterized protein (TIGR03437 family)